MNTSDRLDKIYEMIHGKVADLLDKPCSAEDFVKKIQIVNENIVERLEKEVPGFIVKISDPPRRIYRKRRRWDERNRRRKLKGQPVEQNPYWKTFYYTVNEIVPCVTCEVLIVETGRRLFYKQQEELNKVLFGANIEGPNVVRIGCEREET